MKVIPYVFYSYSLSHEQTDEEVHPSKHYGILKSAHRVEIAYRVQDPSEADKDTMLVVLKSRAIQSGQVLSFYISKRISERKVSVYHKRADEFVEDFEKTADYSRALVVMIPRLQKMAIQDQGGEHKIPASSAISRLSKIVAIASEYQYRLYYEFAASTEDVRRAFKAWSMEEISFSARPFNPHPSTPGDTLSDLMSDNNSTASGKIKARDVKLEHATSGLIAEVLGLSAKGYAEIGGRGTTDRGFHAHIVKGMPFTDVNRPMKIRVMFPERDKPEKHIDDIVDAMEQLYGKSS